MSTGPRSAADRRQAVRRLWAKCGCACVLAAGVAGVPACSRPEASGQSRDASLDMPVPVTVGEAVAKDMAEQIRAIARVEAYATVNVRPQVAGEIKDVHFSEGQDVHAGDLLFSIDARSFDAALRQAIAVLAKDTALADDAEREAAWTKELLQQTVAAQREYEKAQAAADSLRATVRADTAQVDQAGLDLEHCSVRSPIDGRTGPLLINRGNVIKANEATLVTISQINPIYVTLSVPEQNLATIRRHQATGTLAVEAAIPGDDGPPERGELTFVDSRVDDTTGTIMLKGTFANEQRRLWPGQFVNAILTLAVRRGATVVPTQAVQPGQTGQFIFVVKDDLRVELREVRSAFTVGDETVIESGIAPGERVVTDGQLRLRARSKVEIKGSPTTAPATSPSTQP